MIVTPASVVASVLRYVLRITSRSWRKAFGFPITARYGRYSYIAEAIRDEKLYYVFLDEIQLVEGFEEVVDSIKAEFNTDVYITGCNSKLLSHDINTIFRGRGIENGGTYRFPFVRMRTAFDFWSDSCPHFPSCLTGLISSRRTIISPSAL